MGTRIALGATLFLLVTNGVRAAPPAWLEAVTPAGQDADAPLPEEAPPEPDEDRWASDYATLPPATVDEGLARWLDAEYFSQRHFQADYAATLHRGRSVSGQDADLALTQHDVGVRF